MYTQYTHGICIVRIHVCKPIKHGTYARTNKQVKTKYPLFLGAIPALSSPTEARKLLQISILTVWHGRRCSVAHGL